MEQLFGVRTKEESGIKVKVRLVSHSMCGEPCLKFLVAISIPLQGDLELAKQVFELAKQAGMAVCLGFNG